MHLPAMVIPSLCPDFGAHFNLSPAQLKILREIVEEEYS